MARESGTEKQCAALIQAPCLYGVTQCHVSLSRGYQRTKRFIWRVLLQIDETGLHSGYMTYKPTQKKKACIAASLGITGAAGRNRTGDLRITNALLYQLSYSGSAIDESMRALHFNSGR